MNRYLKYSLAAVAGVAFLFALLLVTASLLINPNDYKPQIIQMVKDKYPGSTERTSFCRTKGAKRVHHFDHPYGL